MGGWCIACRRLRGPRLPAFRAGRRALYLIWLLAAPALAILPAAVRLPFGAPTGLEQILAIIDALTGGDGAVLTFSNATNQPAESGTANRPRRARASAVHSMAAACRGGAGTGVSAHRLAPAAADACMVPRRMADDVVAGLAATLAELKTHDLVTPAEEKQLEQEIERVKNAAREKMDASAWEAADAVYGRRWPRMRRQNVTPRRWREHCRALLRRGRCRRQYGQRIGERRIVALEALARSGALAGAPADIQKMLASGKLPGDAASSRKTCRLACPVSRRRSGQCGRASAASEAAGPASIRRSLLRRVRARSPGGQSAGPRWREPWPRRRAVDLGPGDEAGRSLQGAGAAARVCARPR